MKPTLLILAAGIGSRYGGVKQMDKIGPSGESIIDYSIFDAIRAGFGKVVFVINRKIEQDFKALFETKLTNRIETAYVLQEVDNVPEGINIHPDRKKPWGTAHAVLVAKEQINEPFAAINADDFYGRNSFQLVKDYFESTNSGQGKYCMVGYRLKNTLSEHGTVSRGVCQVNESNELVEVVERTKIHREDKGIIFENENQEKLPLDDEVPVSMNFWGFTPDIFHYLEQGFIEFIERNAQDPKAEFYIPSIVSDLINSNKASVKILKSKDRWFGVTYKEDKPVTIDRVHKLVKEGIYPGNLWI